MLFGMSRAALGKGLQPAEELCLPEVDPFITLALC